MERSMRGTICYRSSVFNILEADLVIAGLAQMCSSDWPYEKLPGLHGRPRGFDTAFSMP